MDDTVIARWRLRTQRLTAPHASSAADVVGALLAVQAENPGQSAWAVAARTSAPAGADLAGLLASGEVVRTHVLRPTWHYVARDDIDWLLSLTGPGLRRLIDSQLMGDLGLGADDVDRLGSEVVDLLAAEPDRTRDEVAEALRARVPDLSERVSGRMAMLLMAHLELDRLVVSGRPREDTHTYATYADRVGARQDADRFDRDAALARIAERYFTGHGPATVKDLTYWATLTLGDARRGLEAVRERLHSFEHDGRTYWHAGDEPPSGAAEPAGHLLQLLDEMYRGYQDSRWVLDARGVVPRQRERAIGIGLVDGQLIAAMKRVLSPARVRFELTPHRRMSAEEQAALEEAAARYGEFLARPAEVVVLG
ncbi:MAG TPA: winged helix DNA-binding domain-containing protein [Nocardioides sp.]|nr:winged helix DNA-binding domain-containing protein [Nocardioides sp.]